MASAGSATAGAAATATSSGQAPGLLRGMETCTPSRRRRRGLCRPAGPNPSPRSGEPDPPSSPPAPEGAERPSAGRSKRRCPAGPPYSCPRATGRRLPPCCVRGAAAAGSREGGGRLPWRAAGQAPRSRGGSFRPCASLEAGSGRAVAAPEAVGAPEAAAAREPAAGRREGPLASLVRAGAPPQLQGVLRQGRQRLRSTPTPSVRFPASRPTGQRLETLQLPSLTLGLWKTKSKNSVSELVRVTVLLPQTPTSLPN